jgi:hypothetical protein
MSIEIDSFNTFMTEGNETYIFPRVSPGRSRILELSGDFDGATAKIGYLSPSDNVVYYKVSTGGDDVSTTVEDSWVVDTPSSGKFVIVLVGGSSPNLKVTVTGRA